MEYREVTNTVVRHQESTLVNKVFVAFGDPNFWPDDSRILLCASAVFRSVQDALRDSILVPELLLQGHDTCEALVERTFNHRGPRLALLKCLLTLWSRGFH